MNKKTDNRPKFEAWVKSMSKIIKIRQVEIEATGRYRSISTAFAKQDAYRPIPVKYRIPIIQVLINALGCVGIDGQILTVVDGEFLLITLHGPYAHIDVLVVHPSDILNLFSA